MMYTVNITQGGAYKWFQIGHPLIWWIYHIYGKGYWRENINICGVVLQLYILLYFLELEIKYLILKLCKLLTDI